MEVLPVVILLEERKKFDQVHGELRAEIEALKKRIDGLNKL
jgi:hypothetical protein